MSGRPDRATAPILVVAPGGDGNTGGICRVVADLAASWPGANRAPMRVIDSGGMAPKWRMPFAFGSALLRIAHAGLTGQASLLHVHVADHGSVARKAIVVALGRALRLPVVLHGHGAAFERFVAERNRTGRFAIARVFRAADAVIVLGERARAHLIDALGVAAERVHVVPNPVAPSIEPADTAGRPAGPVCRIVFLGVLGTRKGLDVLLEALGRPELAVAPLALTIVGNGNSAPWAIEAARLGIGDRVRFTGWQDNRAARAIVARSDLLVLPSRAEALPVAILEAMAEAVPVVATAVGVVADAVEHGVTGLVVPPGDPVALAAAIGALVADPDRRRRMGAAGRERADACFAPARVRDALDGVFAAAATRAAARRRQAPGHATTFAVERGPA